LELIDYKQQQLMAIAYTYQALGGGVILPNPPPHDPPHPPHH
jgi:hypothetical protein